MNQIWFSSALHQPSIENLTGHIGHDAGRTESTVWWQRTRGKAACANGHRHTHAFANER